MSEAAEAERHTYSWDLQDISKYKNKNKWQAGEGLTK
jgi:hypothetical protein